MQKNVAGQKWYVFAFDRTDNTPKTGDATQITAEISKDGAAGGGNITDTNPTELEDGYYVFDLEQGETDADLLAILPESSTGNIQVIGVPGTVFTTPVGFPDSVASPSVIPAGYLGDYKLGETLHFAFTTTGTLTGGATVSVYKDDSDTAISPGLVTLDEDFGSETNVHQVSIVFTDTSYDAKADYEVILSGATVGGNTVSATVATFSIQNRYQAPVTRQLSE